MAFNTKLNLSDKKMYQSNGDILTLNGKTELIKDSGIIKYNENPDFTGSTEYNDPTVLVTKGFVQNYVGEITGGGITDADSGLYKPTLTSVRLGGALLEPTEITSTSSNNLTFKGFPVKYDDNVTISNDRDLVDKGYVDTEIGKITTDYEDVLNYGLTGATNGLTATNNVVSLGGGFSTVELDGDGNGTFEVKNVASFKVNAVGGSGASLIMSDDEGLMYGAGTIDYQDKTLVDKAYVDAFSYGITPKTSVKATTIANIDLTGTKTVDGVALSAGDRILVKDQTDKTKNGIYVVASGEWGRAEDFDFTPDSETRVGDLIPVLEGTRNGNSVWALTTFSGDDTNPIEFTEFSKLVDVSAGNGIELTADGGTKTISVDLDNNSGLETSANGLKIDLVTNSGLELSSDGVGIDLADSALMLDGSGLGVNLKSTPGLEINNGLGVLLATNSALNLTNGLAVDDTIAGSGLSFTDGVVSVNAGGTIVGDTIAVKIDTNGDLVVDEDDLPIPSVPVTGGANGLHLDGDNIVLGGDLTGNTVITGSGTKHNLTINNITTLTLSGVTTSIGGVVNILDTPASGTLNTDKFLVRDSAGELKQVDFDYTNLTNNKYRYRLVSGVATLLDTDHVILASAGAELTLPTLTSSDDGLVYKIKNTGGAYASPVEIYGTIDGHSDGMINTDYGSLELMYVHGTGWLTLSFIN